MSKEQRSTLYRIVISFALLVAAWFAPKPTWWLALLAYMVPYLLIGYEVLKEAFENILRGEIFDENFLMALATIGALCIGEYPEAVAVMLFYQVGELFQGYAVGRSRKSIADLMDIRPDYANIEQDGQLVQVDPAGVRVGDVVVVKPGEKIPLDGVIVEGVTSINAAALTGESLPRDARPGDEALSGCVNLTGLIKLRVEKPFGESTVSKILNLVENASEKKAKTESFITRFARYYTPGVVIGALLLAFLPPLLGFGAYAEWIRRALTFLVISCPCALVISIPLSFFGGIGGASRRGILVKGGNHLEALARADVVVMDKTGTITRGNFRVVAVHPERISAPCGSEPPHGVSVGDKGSPTSGPAEARPEGAEAQLLEYAALAEGFSDHPIAASLREAHGEPIDAGRVADVEELTGRGVSATIDGKAVLAGNARLMEEGGIDAKPCELPGTISHVAVDGEYMGHIVISDEPKPDAAQAIAQLKRLGVRKIVMLTGDARPVGEAVARQLGIDEAHCQLMPSDKVDHVERLLADMPKGSKLCFVGDGINDAPVLSRADVAVAMGALGSDAAIEAADIVLMDDKLMGLPRAIRIAKRTIRIARQNIAFALGVKAAVLILGALGIADMWWAVFADVGVSVLAILNAMRALRTGA